MSRSSVDSVPAWGKIKTLGYKPALYLATQDTKRGVVLLIDPVNVALKGIAWWDGEWADDQIEWSTSPITLHSWAAEHPVASQFGPLMHLLASEVHRTAN